MGAVCALACGAEPGASEAAGTTVGMGTPGAGAASATAGASSTSGVTGAPGSVAGATAGSATSPVDQAGVGDPASQQPETGSELSSGGGTAAGGNEVTDSTTTTGAAATDTTATPEAAAVDTSAGDPGAVSTGADGAEAAATEMTGEGEQVSSGDGTGDTDPVTTDLGSETTPEAAAVLLDLGGWQAATSTQLTPAQLTAEYQSWKTSFVQDCPGTDWAVVIKDGGHVVSEGIAYGMLLAAGNDDQALFDKLWKFYIDHVDEQGLMNWSMEICDERLDNDSNAASDGDLDAAMALVQASAAWGGDYLESARTLAANILEHETVLCDGRRVLKPGDVWGGCEDPSGETRINPSYFAPGYYRVFANAFSEQAAGWTELLDGTYELYPIIQDRMDGLFPDWSDFDGADWYGSDFSYDGCRTPWRIAVDYAWTGDERAKALLEKLAARVARDGGVAAIQPQNSAFQGAVALASITDQASFDNAVSAWFNAGGDDSPYFQATLRLLYLHAAIGIFPSTY